MFPNHSCWFSWFQRPTHVIPTSQQLAFALGSWNVTFSVLVQAGWGIYFKSSAQLDLGEDIFVVNVDVKRRGFCQLCELLFEFQNLL